MKGPPAKAMPPVRVGVAVPVEVELALLDAHGRREAGVQLGQSDGRAAAGPGAPAAARPRTPMAGQAWRWRRAVRVTALEQCSATWGKSQRSGAMPAAAARPAEQTSSADAWSTVHWLECHRL